jgi:hypothetical protein
VRQTLKAGRPSLVSLACAAMLAACGGGSGGGSEGRLQVINFTYPGGAVLLSGPRTLSASASSGLPVSFRSGTPATCTVSGSQLTLVAAGECLVIASQGGGAGTGGVQWAAADETSQLFNVLKAPQTVELVGPDYVLSSTTSQVTLSATSSSGLPVTLSGGTPGVCTLAGQTLTLLGKGSCSVTATQAGDASYNPATAMRFIAVDPLIVADGILGEGTGLTTARTKQGGTVTANPWSSITGGWEGCRPNDAPCYTERLSYVEVSADERTFTSALHVPVSRYSPGGWHASYNNIDVFAPGLSGFNTSGDTTGGLQVTTETVLGMTLGVNEELYQAKRPIVVQLDLGKRNNGCNVTVSALLWPFSGGVVGYGVGLTEFAVTEACGLPGVTTASLDNDIRTLPNYWGNTPADIPAAQQAYQAALERIKPARDSAMTLLTSSNIVRMRLRLMDINVTMPNADGIYASDISIVGAIGLQ